jgi:hypothetical protein
VVERRQGDRVYEYLGEPTYEALGKDLGPTMLLIAAQMSLPDGQVRERRLAFTALWPRREEGWRIIESSTPVNRAQSSGRFRDEESKGCQRVIDGAFRADRRMAASQGRPSELGR